MTKEKWVPVYGYEDFYKISNLGRVKSLDREYTDSMGRDYKKKSKIMKQFEKMNGYLFIILNDGNNPKNFLVHRLVMLSFKNIEKADEMTVNHKDKNPMNNTLENLEWMTQVDNNRHSSNLSNEDVISIYKKANETNTLHTEIAEEYNTTPMVVSQIKIGRTWSDLTENIKLNKKRSKMENLSDEIIVRIYKESSKGLKLREVAKKFDVSEAVVCNIKNLKHKKYVNLIKSVDKT